MTRFYPWMNVFLSNCMNANYVTLTSHPTAKLDSTHFKAYFSILFLWRCLIYHKLCAMFPSLLSQSLKLYHSPNQFSCSSLLNFYFYFFEKLLHIFELKSKRIWKRLIDWNFDFLDFSSKVLLKSHCKIRNWLTWPVKPKCLKVVYSPTKNNIFEILIFNIFSQFKSKVFTGCEWYWLIEFVKIWTT